jgi:hypothetical protein
MHQVGVRRADVGIERDRSPPVGAGRRWIGVSHRTRKDAVRVGAAESMAGCLVYGKGALAVLDGQLVLVQVEVVGGQFGGCEGFEHAGKQLAAASDRCRY